ncbi:MAG: trypsin-like peptidase domain-containing protein [Bdellovibrionota bacterium]
MKLSYFLLIVLISQNSSAVVIGDDDLTPVNAEATNIPVQYKKLVNAVGAIHLGCTATHIGNGYVLTAGHCFEQLKAHEPVARDLNCDGVSIEWGLREGLTPYLKSSCQKIVAGHYANNSDFAILKVSPVPHVAIGIDLTRRAKLNDLVTIFSHPDELPLRWSKTCNVTFVKHPNLPSNAILMHKCDARPGSSGATIINVTTKKIVAIHTFGHYYTEEDGINFGTYLTNPEIANVLKELKLN